ncbi:MAG: hypothetical protein DDT31_01919 [Syntrophomonadaceae bacterium]|nr:hypothetical protein [Bacillota bacterium]
MEIRSLGKTGLKVTSLCLGTMTFGNQADKESSRFLTRRLMPE